MILLCRVVLTGVCNELFLLFCIVQGNISTFSCTDADGIFNGYDEDTSVTDLAGMSSLENGMNGFVHILFADYNGNQDSLNGTGVINHSTVNASLTCFANASYIVIGKPFDFGFEQRFFYVLEFGLTDNSFNFFIVVFVFCI